MSDLRIEHVAIDKLRPWERNARTHTRRQIRQIADSIRTFGFNNPVLIGEDLQIITGHGRVDAAKLLGITTGHCLTEAELPLRTHKRTSLCSGCSP